VAEIVRLFSQGEFAVATLKFDRPAERVSRPAISRSSEVLPAPLGR